MLVTVENDSLNPKEIDTAVLFLIFNRIDTTKAVFKEIQKAKPPRLYIACDGARATKDGESELVRQVRDFVLSSIDWQCEVKTLFRPENLGCKLAVSSAINWFFEHEEKGIILEDDVVPNQDFFHFVESNLNKYQDDQRVMMVTGMNYFSDERSSAFFFSEYMNIWGWGTWKRAWKLYDVSMPTWNQKDIQIFFKKKYNGNFVWRHWKHHFDLIKNNQINTWDIQWAFCCQINHGVCITPAVNLITNIGVEGTHTTGDTSSNNLERFELPLSSYKNYSPNVRINYSYDWALYKEKLKPIVLRQDLINFLKAIKLFSTLKKIKRALLP